MDRNMVKGTPHSAPKPSREDIRGGQALNYVVNSEV